MKEGRNIVIGGKILENEPTEDCFSLTKEMAFREYEVEDINKLKLVGGGDGKYYWEYGEEGLIYTFNERKNKN